MRNTRKNKVHDEKHAEESAYEKVEIKQEDDTEIIDDEDYEALLPSSELLPGPKNQPMYYDGAGYYYNQVKEDSAYRWLQCSHGSCGVQARMVLLEGAPITLLSGSEGHSHQPHPERRERICFLHRVKTRHAEEHTPFNVIFQEEAKKNPIGASFFSYEKIEQHLKKKISQDVGSPNTKPSTSKVEKMTTRRTPGPLSVKRKMVEFPDNSSLSKKLKLVKDLQECTPTTSSQEDVSPLKKTTPSPRPQSSDSKTPKEPVSPQEASPSTQAIPSPRPQSSDSKSPKEPDSAQTPPTETPIRRSARKRTGGFYKRAYGDSVQVKKVIQTEEKEKEREEAVTENIVEPPLCEVVNDELPVSEDTNEIYFHRTNTSNKYSERLKSPEFFYDLKGNYYFSTDLQGGERFLQCLQPTCLARAVMGVWEGAEIMPLAGCAPHNHPPHPDSTLMLMLKQLEEQWCESLPSERLPSLKLQDCCYHDGRGYYYHETNQKDEIRFLTCVEASCGARASMTPQLGAAITVSPLRPPHSHPPDHTLREALLFLDAVRVRVHADESPDTAIILETQRNPIGAERVDLRLLRLCLKEISSTPTDPYQHIIDEEVDFATCVKSADAVDVRPSTENHPAVRNHFTAAAPIELLKPLLGKATPSRKKYNQEITTKSGSSAGFKKSAKIIDARSSTESPAAHTHMVEAEKIPALFTDSWIYHDGEGYYYTLKGIHNGRRYLSCVVPKCGARASMSLRVGVIKTFKAHNHRPQGPQYRTELWFFSRLKQRARDDTDKAFSQIYAEEAQKDPEGAALIPEEEANKLMEKLVLLRVGESSHTSQTAKAVEGLEYQDMPPSEKIPGYKLGNWQHHDGRGYYYTCDKQHRGKNADVSYMRCVNRFTRLACPGRGVMEGPPGSTITMTSLHNHEPDFTYREIILFTHELKKRARDEPYTSLKVIYEEEALKFPIAAEAVNTNDVLKRLTRIRQTMKYNFGFARDALFADEDEPSAMQLQHPKERSAAEVLSGRYTPVYHDGTGYYYMETFCSADIRYLICVEPSCLVQARMARGGRGGPGETEGAHSHPPDPLRRRLLQFLHSLRHHARTQRSKTLASIYSEEADKDPIIAAQITKENIMKILQNIRSAEEKGIDTTTPQNKSDNRIEEEELWSTGLKAERLPSLQGQGWVFHDGRGFYYHCHEADKASNRKVLRCSESGCDAVAWLEGGEMRRAAGSVLHNHLPDPGRSRLLVFLHRVTSRARDEQGSLSAILDQEAQRDPEGAALISKKKLRECLESQLMNKYFQDVDTDELNADEDLLSELYNNKEITVEPCETLQSMTSEELVYSNGQGFYYKCHRHTPDILYLSCLKPLCEARAHLLVAAPSQLRVPAAWAQHNHTADICHRNLLLFAQRVRQRALDEDTAVDVIYNEEANREPIGADLASEAVIKNLMHKLRKSKNIKEDQKTECLNDCQENIEKDWSILSDDSHLNLGDFEEKAKDTQVAESSDNFEEEVEEECLYTEPEFLEEDRNEVLKALNKSKKETEKYKPKEPPGPLRRWNNVKGLPTEKLPRRLSSFIYHNGRGYYFIVNAVKDQTTYLRCADPSCGVKASKPVEPEDAPIVPSKNLPNHHNHPPDFLFREKLLFSNRCNMRAASENLSISEIWQAERDRDPKISSLMSSKYVMAKMKRYRQEHAPFAPTTESVPVPDEELNDLEDKVTLHNTSSSQHLRGNSVSDVHQGAVPESIPSLSEGTVWHAAGFFYHTCLANDNSVMCKCVEKGCPARAVVVLRGEEPVSIRLTNKTAHSHGPDPSRRDQLLFMDRCKQRAASSFEHVQDIYDDEASKDPDTAARLSASRVKQAMVAAKKSHMARFDYVVEEGIEGDDDVWSEQGSPEPTKPVKIGPLKPKIGPKAAQKSLKVKEEVNDCAIKADQRYTDYVTLEDESDSYDDEALNTDDDPDYSPEKSGDENKKLYHDGNGYYYILVKDENCRWLECKEGCGVVVPLLQGERPLRKLFSTSPSHRHPSDLDTRRRKNFLRRSAQHRNEHDGPEMEGEFQQGEEIEVEEEELKNTKPSELVPGRKPDTYNYHDGNGFYYNIQQEKNNFRYLKCVVKSCPARAVMRKTPEHAPIILCRHSFGHSHQPDLSHRTFTAFLERCKTRVLAEPTPIKQIYEEEANLDPVSAAKISRENLMQRLLRIRSGHAGTKSEASGGGSRKVRPCDVVQDILNNMDDDLDHEDYSETEVTGEKSEALPGLRPNSTMYHDGKGYYYLFNALKDNKRYVRCVESRCRVRGHMALTPGAPIVVTSATMHNHRADFWRKNFVLFLQHCKDRATSEPTSIQQIYREEANKDPMSASLTSNHNVTQRMIRARKQSHFYPTEEDQTEFEEVCRSEEKNQTEDEHASDDFQDDAHGQTETEDDVNIEYDEEIESIVDAINQIDENNESTTVLTQEQCGPVPEDKLQPSETLPNLRPNSLMYHDGRGYYYKFNNLRDNIMYLRCIEPQCQVRAHKMSEDGAPIIQHSHSLHNHRPSPRRRELALWLDTCRQRAVAESLPIPKIYAEEAFRDPELATLISKENVITRMYRARNSHQAHLAPIVVKKEVQGFKVDGSSTVEEGPKKKTPLTGVLSALANYLSPSVIQTEGENGNDVITLHASTTEEGGTMYLYPGAAAGRPTYTDDQGFCYQQTTIRNNNRYLKCVEQMCRARAHMSLEGEAEIKPHKFTHHNHMPSSSSSQYILIDSDQLTSPVQLLYTDENGGEVALCGKRPYSKRVMPPLTIDPEEPVDISKPDTEPGDSEVDQNQSQSEEQQQDASLKPAEVIPGLRPDANNYHDGNGFYYELNRISQNIRYLKCLTKDCRARAYMELGKPNAPIIQTNYAQHNHEPDPFRKAFTVFLHRVTQRAAREDTPINTIYQQESDRDPLSASQIRMENVKQRMMRFRKKHRLRIATKNIEHATGTDADMDGTFYHYYVEGEGDQLQLAYLEGEEFELEDNYNSEADDAVDEAALYQQYVMTEVEVESQTH